MLQLFFEDVAIAIFGCCNIPPIDIDECCKKHGANVAAEFFFLNSGAKRLLSLLQICFSYVTDVMFVCYGEATGRPGTSTSVLKLENFST